MDKKELRKHMLQKRNRLEENYRKNANAAITEAFLCSSVYQACENIFIYISYSSEVDTNEIITRAISDGKTVLVPLTDQVEKRMDAVQITDFNTQLCQSCCGILEPNFTSREPYPPEKIDLIVVPGVAFDRRGYRIGYGGGYYDKYLSQSLNAVTIGFAYEQSLIDEIPSEGHDQKVDIILTESGEHHVS